MKPWGRFRCRRFTCTMFLGIPVTFWVRCALFPSVSDRLKSRESCRMNSLPDLALRSQMIFHWWQTRHIRALSSHFCVFSFWLTAVFAHMCESYICYTASLALQLSTLSCLNDLKPLYQCDAGKSFSRTSYLSMWLSSTLWQSTTAVTAIQHCVVHWCCHMTELSL